MFYNAQDVSIKKTNHLQGLQPIWTVLFVSSPSIILIDNDPNEENTFATNLATNRPNSFTCSWFKP